ncbi:MAG: transcription elongation factor GreA [Mycoplasma sp.]|nr:transcription elongation factor GreA [Mycoplasma sp.]
MEEKQLNILTKDGKNELKKEYKNLLEIERPKVIEELAEARAQGDLSENAEFDAAREKQGQIEDRIRQIESILENSKVISQQKKTDIIRIGSTFKLQDQRTLNIKEFMIVGSQESNPFEGKISNESPLAESVLGKAKGDVITVDVKSKFKVKIMDIK